MTAKTLTPKIGIVQQGVLDALIRHKGWQNDSGWMWQNRSTTLRALEGLAKKGLARCIDDRPYKEKFAPTEAGIAHKRA